MELDSKEDILKCSVRNNHEKILLNSPKDNNFYNFRSELILKLKKMGNDVV